MNAGEEWTERRSRGQPRLRNDAPPPHSVELGYLSQRPQGTGASFSGCFADHWEVFQHAQSTLSDPLLQWSGGQDARLWQPHEDRVHGIPLSALWSGEARGGDELQILLVLALRQSRRGQLGEPGQQGPPRRRHLSAYHPDGASDVPHNLLPERRGLCRVR